MATIPATADWQRMAREMREMTPPVTYAEIAEIAGVSYTTVWNAINQQAAKANSKRHNDRQAAYRREWNKRQNKRHARMRRDREAKNVGLRAAQVLRHARKRGIHMDEGDVVVLLQDPCAYCGAPATGVDHITPVAHGGAHGDDNLAGCCGECNRQKNTLPLLRFLDERRETVSA